MEVVTLKGIYDNTAHKQTNTHMQVPTHPPTHTLHFALNTHICLHTNINVTIIFKKILKKKTEKNKKKSLIAAQLLAAEKLKHKYKNQIGLLYVVGEEVDHCGMLKANELHLNPKFLIVGEPTESRTCVL